MTHLAEPPTQTADPAAGLSGKRIVLDCRWLGMGGAGRVTELLLAELQDDPPPGEWVLWGRPPRIEPFRFEGAAVVPSTGDPRTWFGQRDALRIPAGELTIFLHQIRPLARRPSLTVIYDTIPLRHGGSGPSRKAKRAFFVAAARASDQIVTLSEFAREGMVRDLGIPPERISVTHLPVDRPRAARIAEHRAELGQVPRLLYLGRFAPHKNLERLCLAFRETRFAAGGGELVLVGGDRGETERLAAWIAANGITGASARTACAEDELDRLLATSRALAQPSLEEGYGLPAFEAAATGLPVLATRTGGMTELPTDRTVFVEPAQVASIAGGIDEVTSMEVRGLWSPGDSELRGVLLAAAAQALASRQSISR